MNNTQKIWDSLSQQYFNNHSENDIELEAVENLYFVWPVIQKCIEEHIENCENKRALDFGCGTGQICSELNSLGFHTTGIDYSAGMIDVAKKNIDKSVKLHVGDSKTATEVAQRNGKFDIITSVLVFPFIEEIEQTLTHLCNSLVEGGLLCFAVFNEDWVREALKNGVDYAPLEGKKGITELIMNFGNNNKVHVFHRDKEEYSDILSRLGCIKLLEEYPLFSEEFVAKVYPKMPKNISEFMILCYRKYI